MREMLSVSVFWLAFETKRHQSGIPIKIDRYRTHRGRKTSLIMNVNLWIAISVLYWFGLPFVFMEKNSLFWLKFHHGVAFVHFPPTYNALGLTIKVLIKKLIGSWFRTCGGFTYVSSSVSRFWKILPLIGKTAYLARDSMLSVTCNNVTSSS